MATTVTIQQQGGQWWLVVDNHDGPARMVGVSKGPYDSSEEAEAAATKYERAANTGGITDAPRRPVRERKTLGDA